MDKKMIYVEDAAQTALEFFVEFYGGAFDEKMQRMLLERMNGLPSAQPLTESDYTEMKQEFLRMASYIDCLLECSDDDKETLLGFISKLAEYMPWTERD